ncbi:DUF4830 domain-containing protein [Paludicola sp. MB14-C6]|uniref:DUF4830 domain-containing protein n=1 Tax=Paludihabitans sp. MB14-C6 TaxID=3070656 RepID=UPI0027DBBACD|nr:DUF4830 domain-containing protein [Paludicola sp. MB14-C6]WMJ23616.1 DUF4830 domain-containing protein [Paludicola sp. MB14-C6]
MFICSLKTSRKKLIFIIIIGLLIIVGAFLYLKMNHNVKTNEMKVANVIVENNDQRVAFLKSFGWNVSSEAVEIVEVAIPAEFNDVYNNYNKIQKAQGFDLEKYKGKRVKRFTYEVLNYPTQKEGVRANMLVYNNKIIGGDICSVQLDGFMHGFKLPQRT